MDNERQYYLEMLIELGGIEDNMVANNCPV
jgi:hypothetical protein